MAFGLVAGTLAAEQAVRYLGAGRQTAFAVAGSVTVAVLVAGVVRRRAVSALALLGVAAGLAIGGAFWARAVADGVRLAASGGSHFGVVVVSDPTAGAFGDASSVRLEAPGAPSGLLRASWPKGVSAPRQGERVEVWGSLGAAVDATGDDRSLREGVVASLHVRRIASRQWEPSLAGVAGRVRAWADTRVGEVPGTAGKMLASVLLGERWRVAGGDADQAMRDAGLAHFESTSGYHVVLFATALEALLVWLGCRRATRIGTQVLAVLGVVTVTGGHLSPLRSWLAGTSSSLGGSVGRRADPLAALALTASAFVAAWPPVVFELGFQLSVLGVGGILLFARLAEAWLEAGLPRALRRAAAPLGATACAIAATLPLTATAFGVVSAVAPLANLLAIPLVLGMTAVGWSGLAVCACWPWLGRQLLLVAGAFADMAASLAASLARLPGAVLPAGSLGLVVLAVWVAVAIGIWAWWPKPTRWRARALGLACACVAGALLMPSPVASGPSVVVMDIGQGDAILVRDGGHAVLVDTGPDATHILAAMARQHVRSLDGVFITHLHADHYGGLSAVCRVTRVPRLFVSQGALAENSTVLRTLEQETGCAARELRDGDRIRVGGIELDVLWPEAPVPTDGVNEASIVMAARDMSETVLLTGDAEAGVLETIAGRGELPAIDVLKVGHHGSAITADPHVLGVMHPRFAVISVGVGNRYGHPKRAALDMLGAAHAAVERTDLEGDITITFTRAGMQVREQHRALDLSARRRLRPVLVGAATVPRCYVTLVDTIPHDPAARETDGFAFRPQDRLPHLRQRGPPPRSSAVTPHQACRRGRRSRLQLRHVRRRVSERRRRRGGGEHAAVHE